MEDYAALFGFFGAMLIGYVIVGLFGIIVYIYSSIITMKVLQRLGYDKTWMAWIPIANMYAWATALYGGIEEVNIDIANRSIPTWVMQWYSPIVALATIVLSRTPIGGLVLLLVIIVQILCFGQIHKDTMKRVAGIEVEVVEQVIVGVVNLVSIIRLHMNMKQTELRE